MSRAQSGTRQRSAEALKVPKISVASIILKWKEFGITTLIRAEQSEPFGEKGRCWGQEQDRAELQSLCADRRKLQKVAEPVCASPHGHVNFAVELTPVEGSRAQQGRLSGKTALCRRLSPGSGSSSCLRTQQQCSSGICTTWGHECGCGSVHSSIERKSYCRATCREHKKGIISTEAHEDNGEGLM